MVRPGVHTSSVKFMFFVINKHTHLTVPPRILHRYCVISLSYHKQTSMMGQEKKAGIFFISRVHSVRCHLPQITHIYICAQCAACRFWYLKNKEAQKGEKSQKLLLQLILFLISFFSRYLFSIVHATKQCAHESEFVVLNICVYNNKSSNSTHNNNKYISQSSIYKQKITKIFYTSSAKVVGFFFHHDNSIINN